MKVLSLPLSKSLAPSLSYICTKTRVKVRSCLKEDEITFTHKSIVNIYIFHEINLWYRGYDDNAMLEQFIVWCS